MRNGQQGPAGCGMGAEFDPDVVVRAFLDHPQVKARILDLQRSSHETVVVLPQAEAPVLRDLLVARVDRFCWQTKGPAAGGFSQPGGARLAIEEYRWARMHPV